MSKPRKIKTEQEARLRIELLKRGWSLADLARSIGFHTDSLATAAQRDFSSKKIQIRIETALGKPIWSTLAEFRYRKLQARQFGGIPPQLIAYPKLIALARQAGMHAPTTLRTKAELVDGLFSFLRSQTKSITPDQKPNALATASTP